MAKWMVPVCLAACLMVVLPVAVRAADGETDETVIDQAKDNAVTEESTDNNQVEETIEKLLSRSAYSMKLEKVREHINILKEAQSKVSLEDLGMPAAWKDLLTLEDKTAHCSEDVPAAVANYAVKGENKGYKWQTKYAFDVFAKFLSNCGYESQYREVAKNFEYWDSASYPTLAQYLEEEFFGHQYKHADKTAFRLERFLSLFSQLAMNGVACDNQQILDDLAHLTFGGRVAYVQLFNLIGEYSQKYFEKCASEEGFKYSLDTFMHSYFFKDVALKEKSAAQAILFAMQLAADELKKETGELATSCNVMMIYIKEHESNPHTQQFYWPYSEYYGSILQDHADACREVFKAKASNFKTAHAEESAFIEKLPETIAKFIKDEYQSAESLGEGKSPRVQVGALLLQFISDIKSGQKEFSGYPVETKDFPEKLKQSCKVLLEHMEPTLRGLAYTNLQYKAEQSPEVMAFMNLVSYCTFKELGIVPDVGNFVRNMFENFQQPAVPQ